MRHPSLGAINQKLRHIPETRVIEKGPTLITAYFSPCVFVSTLLVLTTVNPVKRASDWSPDIFFSLQLVLQL